MQFAKEEIRHRIIQSAKEEFLRHGFERASIRTIMSNAQTSKSNLYNYFKNKDALFYAVVEPALSNIYKGLELAKYQSESQSTDSYTFEVQKDNIRIVANFVFQYPDEIKLLLFNSGGSALEGFKSEIIDRFTDILVNWFQKALPHKTISRFFIRCISSFYISTIEQMLLDGVSRESAEQHFDEFVAFVYSGWRGVMQ